MKLTKKLEVEITKFMKTYWDTYFTGDLKTWATFLADDYKNIGGTEDEIWNSKKEILDYSEQIINQLVGQAEIRNTNTQIYSYDPYIMVHEFTDMYIKVDKKWALYGKFRLSSIIQKNEDGWQVLHQHGSFPDSKAAEGEAFSVDALKSENLKLLKAVKDRTAELEEKNRELQIETVLERVRARTMGMQKSEELREVIQVVYDQFVQLNIHIEHTGFILDYKKREDMLIWLADKHGVPSPQISIPYFDSPHWNSFVEAKKQGIHFFTNQLDFKTKNKFYKQLFKLIPGIPQETIDFYLSCPALAISTVLLDNVGLYIENFKGIPYTDEENKVLMRFGKVFQQTYTRFLDLQKAEAQAREAQIEAALEKVRSSSLAMQNSEELNGVVAVVFEKIKELQIPATAVGIATKIEGSKDSNAFVCGENEAGLVVTNYRLPYFNNRISKEISRVQEKQIDFYVGHYTKKEKDSFYKFLFENSTIANVPEDIKSMIFESPSYTISMVATKHALFNINDFEGKELSENDIDILKRFAKVFEQAYTRFLDLQKAEAQAREAQIEAAVERVRAQSMAMHQTSDVNNVTQELLKQLNLLKVDGLTGTSIYLVDGHDIVTVWDISSPGSISDPGSYAFTYDAKKFPLLGGWVKIFKTSKQDYFVLDFPKKLLIEGIREMKEILPEMAVHLKAAIESGKLTHQWSPVARLSNGILAIDLTVPPTDDTKTIVTKMAGAFNQAYQRFLDLQKAEAQAKEAQIEAALERVRSRSMAMHKSEELLDAGELLYRELSILGIPSLTIGYVLMAEDEKIGWNYTASPADGKILAEPVGVWHNQTKNMKRVLASWKKQEPYHFVEMNEKETIAHQTFIAERSINFPYTADQLISFSPPRIVLHNFNFKEGYLLIVGSAKLTSEQEGMMVRFTKVFQQTYTRFLDLQKAEAQAREAQIEVSLERIRSRSMAMHTSDELPDVGALLYQELSKLSIENLVTGYTLMEDEGKMGWNYGVNPLDGKVAPLGVGTPHTTTAVMRMIRDSWLQQEPLLVFTLDPEETIAHQTFMAEKCTNFPISKEKLLSISPEKLVVHTFNFSQGYLLIVGGTLLTKEQQEMVTRFAKVFQQTYTRFLDLQTAEAQAKEAKIEFSLEKVRSVALGLTKSDQMLEVAQALYEQLTVLGFTKIRNAIIDLHNDDNATFWDYDYSKEMGGTITLMSYKDDPIIEAQLKTIVSSTDAFFEIILEGQELQDLIDMRLRNGEAQDPRLLQTKQLTYNLYSFGNGAVGISNFGIISEEQKNLLKRFRNVFTFAYKRYSDLADAERRAREAQIEASLEKVRSVALGLTKSEQMLEVSQVLYEQLLALGFTNIRNAIIDINNDDGKTFTDYDYSHEMQGAVTVIAKDADPTIIEQIKKTEESNDAFFEVKIEGEELKTLIEERINLGERADPRLNNTDILTYNLYSFGNGAVGISNFGVLTDEHKLLLKRFRNVFTFAYKRHRDLAQAERLAKQADKDLKNLITAKKKTDDALAELKATQSQLIQSEKMASLGELTAGIAHEIQNPLNFVNNFSEVSTELVDEVLEGAAKGNYDEIKEILLDVKRNLEKINHHGRRADGIVKGMLQHSRSSSGTKEPTDINALADEYLRLAYHGLRAKDKSFNATLQTDYAKDIGAINIISQDIGRVLLNLITNAFYAIDEKKKACQTQDGDSYEPTVLVKTKKVADEVFISVTDNGNGILQKVLDKIFQPFFTTKPTGQGTGLGLSLSYDIVKAHGGEIKVESTEGEGSSFIITLPC